MTVKRTAAAAKASPRARKSKRATSVALDGGRARDQEVIEAAIQIFWEKGYASSSVQDVADALGMLKGSLYYYIDSKESLLDKIFEDSHSDLMQITKEAMEAEGPALDRLTRFLNDYAMWTLTHLERAGLYSREWRYASDARRATLADQQRYYDRSLRTLITEGQTEGKLATSMDPRLASLFIWAAFTGIPDWPHIARMPVEDVASNYVALALRACGAKAPSVPARSRKSATE